jgi:hypothetical protein
VVAGAIVGLVHQMGDQGSGGGRPLTSHGSSSHTADSHSPEGSPSATNSPVCRPGTVISRRIHRKPIDEPLRCININVWAHVELADGGKQNLEVLTWSPERGWRPAGRDKIVVRYQAPTPGGRDGTLSWSSQTHPLVKWYGIYWMVDHGKYGDSEVLHGEGTEPVRTDRATTDVVVAGVLPGQRGTPFNEYHALSIQR